MAEKTVKALPLVPPQYDPVNESINRRTIEQAMQDMNSEIGHVKDMQESGISKAVKRHIFLLMGSSHCCFNGGYISAMLTAGAGISFPDGEKAFFGDGNDLKIYHDGSNSYIQDSGTGNLRIAGQSVDILNPDANEFKARFVDNGRVELYYDNSKKFETTSSGIDVTGTTVTDGITSDGSIVVSGNDRNINFDNSTKIIGDHSVDGLQIRTQDTDAIVFKTNGNNIRCKIDGSGNVGIGTTNPQAKLHVDGDVYVDTGHSVFADFYKAYSTALSTYGGNTSAIHYFLGKVGIGISSPAPQSGAIGSLHIHGSSTASEIKLTNSSTGSLATDGTALVTSGSTFTINNREAGAITFGTSNSERARIDSSGRLLIGDTSTSFNDILRVFGDGYAGGWRTGTSSTYVGKMHNNAGKLALETDGSRDIQFGNSTNTQVMYIDTSEQNVGIGTTSPSEKLSIAPDTDVSAEIGKAHIGSVGHSDYAGFAHVDKNTTSDYALLQGAAGDTFLNASAGERIKFRIGNSEKATFDSSGKLGIGTSSPNQKLVVVDTGGETTVAIDNATTTTGNHARLDLRHNGITGSQIKSENIEDFTTSANRTSNLSFHTRNNGTQIEAVRIKEDGNVGIGTVSPATRLEVKDDSGASTTLRVSTDGTATPDPAIQLYRNSGAYGEVRYNPGGSIGGESGLVYTDYRDDTSSKHIWQTRGAEKMRLDSVGNLGIGTTSPNERLHIQDAATSDGTSITIQNSFGESSKNIKFRNTDTVETARIEAYGRNNTSFPPYLAFHVNQTTGSSASNDVAERMRIDSSGNVGIGETSPDVKLHVKDTIQELFKLETNQTSGYARFYEGASERLRIGFGSHVFSGIPSATDVGIRSSNNMHFGTDNNIRMTIRDSDGNVGIGTTAPATKLDVTTAGPEGIVLSQDTGNSAISARLFLESSSGNFAVMNSSGRFNIRSGATTGSSSGTERVSITQDGDVGIGTTSPSTGLHVYRTTTDTVATFESGDPSVAVNFTASDNSMQIATSSTDGIIKNNGAGSFRLFNNGSERVRIDSSGKFGIGTTSPSSYWSQANDLVIAGSSNRGLTIQSGSSGNGRLVFTDQTSSNPGFTDGGQIHYDHTNDVMNLRTSGTDAITIDSSQNVGIGTTSPAQLLDVDGVARFGTSTYRITLDGKSGGGYFKIGTTSNDDSLANFGAFSSSFVLDTTQVNGFVFKHNGAEKMRLNSSGNLGIGTTSPAEDLHIKDNGDVSIALENQSDTSGNYWKLWQDNWDGSTTFTFNIDYGTTNVIKAKTTGDVTVPTGNLGIGTTSPTEKLDINSDGIRVRTAQTPASASAAGDQGQICWDANYVYVCVATNTWKRAALSTW